MNQKITALRARLLIACSLFYLELVSVSEFRRTTSAIIGKHTSDTQEKIRQPGVHMELTVSSTPTETREDYYRSFIKEQFAASENSYQVNSVLGQPVGHDYLCLSFYLF